MGCKATAFLKQVADLLSTKWDKAYGSVMGWICLLQSFVPHFCVFGGVTLGNTYWGIVDGASIAIQVILFIMLIMVINIDSDSSAFDWFDVI